MSLKYKFIDCENVTARQIIKRWLILWIIDDWVKTRISFWFLTVWTINLNFSNALSVFECLISFTKRKLKIRTSESISALLIDKKISFSSKSTIFCCLDAMSDESAVIELRIKLRYAIEAKYFLDRSRSRFDDDAKSSWWMKMRTSWSIAKWSFSNSMNKKIFNDDDDEFSSSTWSFW
jgi:hypothetical protein